MASRVAAAAARRALLADVLLLSGRGLLVGGAAALVAVGAGKFAGRELRWEWVVGAALGLGMLSGIAWAVSRRWSRTAPRLRLIGAGIEGPVGFVAGVLGARGCRVIRVMGGGRC